jgi:peptide/nickel transport system permease protein
MSAASTSPGEKARGRLARAWDSDIAWSFRHSPIAVVSALVVLVCFVAAFGCDVLAPHDPFNLASLSLSDSFLPPVPLDGSSWSFVLGTDDQGRDVLSAIMYGARISLIVGFAAIVLALGLGIALGLIAGYFGGFVDAILMRSADVQLSFPSLLIALLVDGIVRALLPHDAQNALELYVLIFAIGISRWPQFARTVRGSTLVERGREYVMAARVIGIGPTKIMVSHILPNVLSPVLVLATINLGLAILDEATLSFLGLGLPPTRPSLGTLIANGNNFLYSGDWWITLYPGIVLAGMVLAINLLGDWLRDALNPRLR